MTPPLCSNAQSPFFSDFFSQISNLTSPSTIKQHFVLSLATWERRLTPTWLHPEGFINIRSWVTLASQCGKETNPNLSFTGYSCILFSVFIFFNCYSFFLLTLQSVVNIIYYIYIHFITVVTWNWHSYKNKFLEFRLTSQTTAQNSDTISHEWFKQMKRDMFLITVTKDVVLLMLQTYCHGKSS